MLFRILVFSFCALTINAMSHVYCQDNSSDRINKPSKAETRIGQAWFYLYSNPQKALGLADDGMDFAILRRDTSILASYYRFYGLYSLNNYEYVKAIEYFSKALKLVRAINDRNEIAYLYSDLGLCYLGLFKNKEAEQYFIKSLNIVKNLNKKSELQHVLLSLSLTCQNSYDFVKSVDYLLQAIRISEELQDSSLLAREFNNLAIIYNFLQNSRQSLLYFNIALEINKKLGNDLEIAFNLNNIANVYNRTKKYDEALVYFKESLKIKKKLDNLSIVASTLNNIGEVYLLKKDYNQALQYFNESLKLKEETKNLSGIPLTHFNIGKAHYEANRLNEAEYSFLKALELGKLFGAPMIDPHYFLSELYQKTKDFHKSIQHLHIYSALQDSAFSSENVQGINELISGYKIEKKDNKIIELEIENEVKQRQLTERAWFIAVLILFSVAILFISLYLRKNLAITKALSLELQDKAKQLADSNAKLKTTLEQLNKTIEIQKLTESELIKANNKLEAIAEKERDLNALKSRFISMVTHEYRDPLSMILTASELLKRYHEKDDDENLDLQVKNIRKAVESMVVMLNDVLIIGKHNSDSSRQLTLQKTHLPELCKDAISNAKQIHKTDHKFILNFDSKVGIITTDPFHLTHILKNLLSNAIRYSPDDPEIFFSISALGNDKVAIEIKDNGIGIPDEDKNYLFDPFFRSSNIGLVSGAGLGLTVVKLYVEAIHGELSIDSKVKKGTKLRLIIPVEIKE